MKRISKKDLNLSAKKQALLGKLLEREGLASASSNRIPPRQDRATARLSFAQRRLWFIDQLDPFNSAYNDHFAIRLAGTLNLPALQQSIDRIVERHESLRTTFVDSGPEPLQLIAPSLNLPIQVVNLDSGQDAKAISLALAAAEARRRFDLRSGPLLRITLITLADNSGLLLFTIHHIISDGWSLGILVDDVAAIYAAILAGQPGALAELPAQYGDYAEWQRQCSQGTIFHEQLVYWKERLSGAASSLNLPLDRPRPAEQSLGGARCPLRIPADLANRLRLFSRQRGATTTLGLLAALKALLHRYTGESDLLIGIPVAGRGHTDTERLIGFFANTVVLRTEVSGDLSFDRLLAAVKTTVLSAFANQDLPFEILVEELKPERRLGLTPLFQVAFSLQEDPTGRLRLPGLTVERIEIDGGTAKFDLTFDLIDTGDEIRGAVEYSRNLFDESTIERMTRHLLNLLEACMAHPERRLWEASFLTEYESEGIVADRPGDPPDRWRTRCVHSIFGEQVEQAPDAVAAVYEGQHLTYRELNGRANQLARYLTQRGVGVESRVGIFVERSLEMLIGLLGIVKAGAVYVPLDLSYPEERLSYLIGDSQVAILVARRRRIALPVESEIVSLEEDWEEIASDGEEYISPPVDPKNLIYTVYTSGSTGAPKGVAVEHRSVVNLVKDPNYCEISPSDVFVQFAPVAFDASTFEIWGSLLNGARLVIFPSEFHSLEQLGRVALESQVTTVFFTTGLFHQIVEQQLDDLKNVRQILTGGETLSPAHIRRAVKELPGRMSSAYGPTEATTFSTTSLISQENFGDTVPLGSPVSGTGIYILDERLQPVPIGVAGEIFVAGAGLARGYLNRSDLTAARFTPNPFSKYAGDRLYRTGDLARYRKDRNIEFIGRLDNQVKIRGFRVELGEIETALSSHQAVDQTVVIAQGDAIWDRRLVAYVTGEETLCVEDLRAFLQKKLPDYMMPSVFMRLDHMPLTVNGKIDRGALPKPLITTVGSGYATPRDAVEEILCGIWSELLGVERVGVEDNFFELGGHSLLATQLASRARSALGAAPSLRSLFTGPTVAEMAREFRNGPDKVDQAPPIIPVERGQESPLSFAQQRLWFIDRMDPGSAAYNVPSAAQMNGELNAPALEQGLREIVRRHEVLRTTFPTRDGEPVQRVSHVLDINVALVDLGLLEKSERDRRAREIAREESARGFDLFSGPLVRASLLRLSSTEHVLLVTMSHIVSDGWSVEVMVREFVQLYESFSEGRPPLLPTLPIQYADYAAWQRLWLVGPRLKSQLDYWRGQLNAIQALELPADRPRPAAATYAGAVERFTLSGDLAERLNQLSRSEGVTLFMALLAGFQLLLSRHTGCKDVTVGSPIAGRNREETETLIGFFVNTLVMRTNLAGNPTVRELLARTRETALGAYSHQDLPFEKLVEELQPERSLNHQPLFQVMFAVQDSPLRSLRLPCLEITPLDVDSGKTKFDLTLFATRDSREIVCSLEYAADLFDAGTIRRMSAHFRRALEFMAGGLDRRIGDVSLLSEEEWYQAVTGWNLTSTEYPADRLVHQLFQDQVAIKPQAVALVYEDQQLSYGELNRRANQLAHYLRKLGVGPEQRTVILIERSIDLIVGLLGALKAGSAYLPLDPTFPPERLAYMIEDADAPVVLTQDHLWKKLPSSSAGIVRIDADWDEIGRETESDPEALIGPRNLVYVMYTSGSTGYPKGVAVEHRNVVKLVRAADYAEFGPEEIFLQFAPVTFDASTFEIWGCLLNGGRLVVFPPEFQSVEQLGAVIKEAQVTTVWLTAGLFHQMVDERLADLENLRQLLAGGDVLSPDHIKKVLRRAPSCRVINGYGPTEGTTFSCCFEVAGLDQIEDSAPIGRPISNTRTYILDENLQPVPVGVAGELYIGGAGLARGYLNRPDLTAEKFTADSFSSERGGRLYRTGDLARYLRDGIVDFLGRRDYQVKVRGFRVELGEIESALRQYAGIEQSIVVARADEGGDRRLIAYLVGSQPIDAGDLSDWLRSKLPEYMAPSVFVQLDEAPLTNNGKIDRLALPEPQFTLAGEHQGPRNALEEILHGIWAEALGVEQFGIEDNFFDLGGHSLLATKVVSRVRSSLGVELPLRALFVNPTIAALARLIDDQKKAGHSTQAPPITRAARDQETPLSFAQQRLWFINQLHVGSARYNLPFAVRITGSLETEVLVQSLSEITRRHEILRAGFVVTDGVPHQRMQDDAELSLRLVDLRSLDEPVRVRESRLLAAAEATREFDLAAPPLWRAKLLRLSDVDSLLLVTMSHIVSDGWSLDVMMRELAQLYESFQTGRPSPLPELPIQYADYVIWQREWLQGERLDERLRYWREQLGGVAVLEIPTDRARPPIATFRGSSEALALSPELTEELKRFSRQEGVTLFMTLMAAYMLLLARYSGQSDVAVGTPIAGRIRRETEDLIGFFVNTLVMRANLSGNPTARELLGRVRETALGAYMHQELPFEKLVEELRPQRSLNHEPLFQVMLALQNIRPKKLRLPSLDVVAEGVPVDSANFDMSLWLVEDDEGVHGDLEYAADLFDRATITRFLDHLRKVLRAIATDVESRILDIQLLSDAERRQVLIEWNRTTADYPIKSVRVLFEEQAEHTPDRVAVAYEDEQVSYATLNRRANRVARSLKELRIGPDALVGVYVERSLDMAIALLGALKTGGAYLPLDPEYPSERLSYMIEQSGAAVVLTSGRLAGRLPETSAFVADLNLAADCVAAEYETNLPDAAVPENLAYVIYTSGSTGRPKGVAVRRRGLTNFLATMIESLRPSVSDVFVAVTSLSFDISNLEIYLPLVNGSRLEIAAKEVLSDGYRLTQMLSERQATYMQATPATWRLLVEAGWAARERFNALCGGEALSPELAGALAQEKTALWNLYGPTETTIWSTISRVERSAPVVSIGHPIGNTQVYILDQNLAPVPIGVVGELYIGGDGLARGYLNQPHLTAELFSPDPFNDDAGGRLYRTGDLARYSATGAIQFLGRVDHQIKLRGFRIEPGEIESALRRWPGVKQSVVTARRDALQEPRLVAYITAEEQISGLELREFLREEIPDYMLPAAFVQLDALPLTPNGKLDRRRLPAPTGSNARIGEGYVAPRNEIESKLTDIWRHALQFDQVGVFDNFFDIGGHSLMMVQVQAELREAFHIEVTILDLFKHPTIDSLARRLAGVEGRQDELSDARRRARQEREARSNRRRRRESQRTDLIGQKEVGQKEAEERQYA